MFESATPQISSSIHHSCAGQLLIPPKTKFHKERCFILSQKQAEIQLEYNSDNGEEYYEKTGG